MRILPVLTLCLLTIACKPTTPEPIIAPYEKTAVKALVQGIFDDVWGGLDSTKILDYHTADFMILENGEVWTNKEIGDYVRRSLEKDDRPTRINTMEYISMDKYGSAINVAYHNYARFEKNDSLLYKGQWLESATAVQTDKGWRLKTMHSTWVPQER